MVEYLLIIAFHPVGKSGYRFVVSIIGVSGISERGLNRCIILYLAMEYMKFQKAAAFLVK
jgi:hypothetical protein